MKKITTLFIIILFLLIDTPMPAQDYRPIDNGSSVKFIIKNFGLDVGGKFSGLEGNIKFDPADLINSFFTVSVDASTVNTGIGMRDNHLRQEEYLNTKKFPKIHFVSQQITYNSVTRLFVMKGMISIKGINKEVSFPFKMTPGNDGVFFKGEFKLNRHDFKVGGKSVVLSGNITIVLSVFAKKN